MPPKLLLPPVLLVKPVDTEGLDEKGSKAGNDEGAGTVELLPKGSNDEVVVAANADTAVNEDVVMLLVNVVGLFAAGGFPCTLVDDTNAPKGVPGDAPTKKHREYGLY